GPLERETRARRRASGRRSQNDRQERLAGGQPCKESPEETSGPNAKSVVKPNNRIRYAVIGLGHIAQVAVLPAFAHAKRNSALVAVVSDDPTKRREIANKYRLERTYSYSEYEHCLKQVDAVYIALP